MAKQRVKKQHFVPQFYLRHFANDKEMFFAFDKPEGKTFPTSVYDVASTNYFYDLDPRRLRPGASVQIVETELAKIEGMFSECLREVLGSVAAGSPLTPEQKEDLSYVVAMQFIRTQEFRETYEEGMNKLMRSVLPRLMKDRIPEGDMKSYEVSLDKEALKVDHADCMFGPMHEKVAAVLRSHIWYVIRAPEGSVFYTSDAPVVKMAHVSHPLLPGIALMSPGIEMVFPLSSRYVLTMRERTHHKKLEAIEMMTVDLPEKYVVHYNSMQVLQSKRQVFCLRNDFALAEKIIAETPEVRDPQRPRMRVM